MRGYAALLTGKEIDRRVINVLGYSIILEKKEAISGLTLLANGRGILK